MDDHRFASPQAIEGRLSFFAAHPSASFRADTDQAGEWYVWTRLARQSLSGGAANGSHDGDSPVARPTRSAIGWATMQRCDSRELAQRLADDLNQRALRVAV